MFMDGLSLIEFLEVFKDLAHNVHEITVRIMHLSMSSPMGAGGKGVGHWGDFDIFEKNYQNLHPWAKNNCQNYQKLFEIIY